ncbi:MAG: diguanylate cyclase [Firmicutes bacterium]|nr:diguanylate cyclase [Bacillota bacterium]
MNTLNKLKKRLVRSLKDFFPNNFRKIEFASLILAYFLIRVVILNTPDEYKGVTAAAQSFITYFLAFRFGFIGLVFAFIFIAHELRIITGLYLTTHEAEYIVAVSVKMVTVISAILVAIIVTKQEQHQKELHKLSITDGLTGLYNQRYFHEILEQQFEEAKKTGGSLGLIMMDIDDFKLINDIYGHDFGDTILRGAGKLLNDLAKEGQFVCRCGGDEFTVVIPNADINTIEKIAEHFKSGINKLGPNYFPKEMQNKISLSMGLSEYPHLSSDKDELFTQADTALYHAKNLGKDKIHFYQDIMKQLRKGISTDHQQLIGAFKALLSTISAKDKYTLGHSERVSAYAVTIGEALGLSPKEICTLQYAGLLHDIGKIEIPKSILNKTGRLTDEEFALIHMHPIYGENILEPLNELDQLLLYVRHHHERFDGKGYPDGLNGKQISLGARILCVADSFDAMLSERPYSPRKTIEQAIDELKRCSGRQFDPQIVTAFLAVLESEAHKKMKALINW